MAQGHQLTATLRHGVGAGAWRTMYSSETIGNCDTPGYNLGEADCANAIKPNSLDDNDSARKEKSNGYAAKSQSNGSSGSSNLKSLYSHALSNDNIVIVETSPAPQRPQKEDVYRNGGGQPDRASRTLRSLMDEELPQPDMVRKAKDVFETLAKKHLQESPLKRHQSSVQDFSRMNQPSSALARSQSLLVLTGRTWCNGSSLASTNGYRHGASSDCLSGSRAAATMTMAGINNNDYNYATNYKKAPPYQRSCSELDKFFQEEEEEEEDDDDLWERHARDDRGSPVSPEVIQKIRDHGTCVQFFGSDAYVVENDVEDINEDDLLEERAGYLLEYPYELYPEDGSVSSKPKIIGTLPKTSSGSCASSMSSAYGGRETPSPAPPSPYSGFNGWFVGGCGVSLDDIRASLKMEDSDGSRPSSSLGSGFVKLKQRYGEPRNGHRIAMTIERCHGKWMKNPFWQGSYYVIYDFTQSAAEPHFQMNGN